MLIWFSTIDWFDVNFKSNANVRSFIWTAWNNAILSKRFVRVQRGSLSHIDEHGVRCAVRMQVWRIQPLKNGHNDAVWSVLVRNNPCFIVAVCWMVQVEVHLHFFTCFMYKCVYVVIVYILTHEVNKPSSPSSHLKCEISNIKK